MTKLDKLTDLINKRGRELVKQMREELNNAKGRPVTELDLLTAQYDTLLEVLHMIEDVDRYDEDDEE